VPTIKRAPVRSGMKMILWGRQAKDKRPVGKLVS
jgi:hypothetical protein